MSVPLPVDTAPISGHQFRAVRAAIQHDEALALGPADLLEVLVEPTNPRDRGLLEVARMARLLDPRHAIPATWVISPGPSGSACVTFRVRFPREYSFDVLFGSHQGETRGPMDVSLGLAAGMFAFRIVDPKLVVEKAISADLLSTLRANGCDLHWMTAAERLVLELGDGRAVGHHVRGLFGRRFDPPEDR